MQHVKTKMPAGETARAADLDSDGVCAAQSGDREALAALLHRHERGLLRHLRRFTSNPVSLQDLRQETYLEACRSLGTYQQRGPFAAWLRQIATRVGYRFWANRTREWQARTAFIQLTAPQPFPWNPCDDDTREKILQLVVMLKPCDRTLVELRYLHGLTTVEIARRLGWNVSRVRVRLHRALNAMRSGASTKMANGKDAPLMPPRPPSNR